MSVFDMLGSSQSSGGVSILMAAVGAALRGESPQTFMKRLANQHPQLKRLNLDDLQGTANQLCQQNGLNADEVAREVDRIIDPAIHK